MFSVIIMHAVVICVNFSQVSCMKTTCIDFSQPFPFITWILIAGNYFVESFLCCSQCVVGNFISIIINAATVCSTLQYYTIDFFLVFNDCKSPFVTKSGIILSKTVNHLECKGNYSATFE